MPRLPLEQRQDDQPKIAVRDHPADAEGTATLAAHEAGRKGAETPAETTITPPMAGVPLPIPTSVMPMHLVNSASS
jgi:hypothetical protein